MSIFKTSGIILQSKKNASKENLYSIFTLDYGKILCNKKFSAREKSLDIGYLINFEIEVKDGRNIHKIKNIKIINEFQSLNQNYRTIYNFLSLISLIQKKLPEKLQNSEVFETLKNTIEYHAITPEKIILIRLKILHLLGILNTHHSDTTIEKVLQFIYHKKAPEILKLTGLKENHLGELEKLISNSISNSF